MAMAMAALPSVVSVIKCGGAALTNKKEKETMNEDGLPACVDAVVNVVSRLERAGQGAVLVHGAGSFGHHTAREYGLRDAVIGEGRAAEDTALRAGVSGTRLSVTELNHRLVARLQRAGVAAVGMSPLSLGWFDSSFTAQAAVDFMPRGARAIGDAVGAGFLPVIHGDCVLRKDDDGKCKVRILSGDEIVYIIQRMFRASCRVCCFLTNVDGVYDRDPRANQGADAAAPKLLRCVYAEGEDRGTDAETSSSHADVTGAMGGKLGWAKMCAGGDGAEVRVRIASAFRAPDNWLACLPEDIHRSSGWTGTEVKTRREI